MADNFRSAFDAYKEWALNQSCQFCGKKRKDRKPGDVWVTEIWCGCEPPAGAKPASAREKLLSDGLQKVWDW